MVSILQPQVVYVWVLRPCLPAFQSPRHSKHSMPATRNCPIEGFFNQVRRAQMLVRGGDCLGADPSRLYVPQPEDAAQSNNSLTHPALLTSVGCAYTTFRDHALAQGALRRCPRSCSSSRGASPSRQGLLLESIASLVPCCRHAACSLGHPVYQPRCCR